MEDEIKTETKKLSKFSISLEANLKSDLGKLKNIVESFPYEICLEAKPVNRNRNDMTTEELFGLDYDLRATVWDWNTIYIHPTRGNISSVHPGSIFDDSSGWQYVKSFGQGVNFKKKMEKEEEYQIWIRYHPLPKMDSDLR